MKLISLSGDLPTWFQRWLDVLPSMNGLARDAARWAFGFSAGHACAARSSGSARRCSHDVRVLGRELVSVLAVRLPGVFGGEAHTAQKVLALRHRLQMPRVAAAPVPAEVVDLEPLGNRTDQQLPRESVRVSEAVLSEPRRAAVPARRRQWVVPAIIRNCRRAASQPRREVELHSVRRHAAIYHFALSGAT